MPKIFTDERRNTIREKLIRTGIELFGTYGFRRVSIDELIGKCGIAKGSFYTFYAKKEYLLKDCLKAVRRYIDELITKPTLENEIDPEDAIPKLIGSGRKIYQEFPICREYYNPLLMDSLQEAMQVSENTSSVSSIAPLPVFEKVLSYYREQGFTIDITPHILEQCTEALLLVSMHNKAEQVQEGLDQIIDFTRIGCTGYISNR